MPANNEECNPEEFIMRLTEGLIERIQSPPQVSDLPLWRKILILSALGFLLFVFARGVDEHFTIYGSSPDHPVPSAGQVYEVDVMHGNIRYVTLQTKESFDLWAGTAVTWAGAAFIGAFLLWIASPRKSARKSSRVQPFIGPRA